MGREEIGSRPLDWVRSSKSKERDLILVTRLPVPIDRDFTGKSSGTKGRRVTGNEGSDSEKGTERKPIQRGEGHLIKRLG